MSEWTAEQAREAITDIQERAGDGCQPSEWSIICLNEYVAQSSERIDELQSTFDLRWKADMRAIRDWQKAHPGNELVWPDHADLVVWLLNENHKLRKAK